MAMTIRNDSGSMMALGQLKKNDSSLEKQLKKVSSGMRTNSAGDDASGYSISERMRTLIRALGQDIQNTKNGKDLVAAAEGGIQEIINNLRSMKEMAINSANDHNTDLDRETLEKEFASRKETIADIAGTTNYNGRLLLTGDYKQYHIGGAAGNSQASYSTLTGGFQPAFNSCWPSSNMISNQGKGIAVDSSFIGDLIGPGHNVWDYWTETGQTWTYRSMQYNQIAVSLDFSGFNINYPTALDGKGFSILCGQCGQYIDIKFDANTTQTTYTSTPSPPAGWAVPHKLAREFTIGIQNVTKGTDLAKAIFEGIKSVQSQIPVINYTFDFITSNPIDTSPTNILIDTCHYLRMAEINGNYYYLKGNDQCELQFINRLYNDQPYNFEFEVAEDLRTPLIIHTGSKANQHLEIFINGMFPENLGIGDTHVTPREAALRAINDMDNALAYSLNEITRMGAYRMRLGQTEENLVTNEENTQAAESIIRDADMAKEMTDYAKANIMTQSAQAMLAQANQNSSNVLNLLK